LEASVATFSFVSEKSVLLISFDCYFSAVIGEIDDDTDSSLDMANIKADPLNPVVY
jgi:hypothetical protein